MNGQPRMRRTPRALARRIDRLARHAHAFHRFAHHPLCDRYVGEVMALNGRWRVCRGCLAVLLGLVVGLGMGLCLPAHPLAEVTLGGLATLLGVTSLVLRLPKVIARFVPAAFASTALAASFHRACEGDTGAIPVVAAMLLVGACGILAYRQRGPNRTTCDGCPERLGTVPCSGIAPIIRRERAFQRLSQRWLDASSR